MSRNRILVAVLTIVFVLASGCQVRAAEKFRFLDSSTTWDQVKSLAADSHKLVFVDCSTSWCVWCKKMEHEVFPDSAVAEYMTKEFVGVKYDMEVGIGITLAMKYCVNAFPTFLIVDGKGDLVYKTMGYRPADKFLADITNAVDPAKRISYPGISAAIDPGFPPFYRPAYLKGDARKTADSVTVNSYLASVSDLSSEPAWAVMHRFIGRLGPKFSDYVFDNGSKLKSLYGSEDVEFVMSQLLNIRLESAIKKHDEPSAVSIVSLAEKNLVSEKTDWRSVFMQQYYVGTGEWNKAVALFESQFSAVPPPSAGAINEFSWTIYEKCDDPVIVGKAAGWMKDVVTKTTDYASMDTYAALLYKAKDYKNAEAWALKAIEQAKVEKSNSKETEELLEKIRAATGSH
ncbi:MAG TPA: thioredoxin fold domain-containing protein [Bacteroidota bacterium]|nr:thioredoxin fold domain-containing protein [Bacteroidota bacterium]